MRDVLLEVQVFDLPGQMHEVLILRANAFNSGEDFLGAEVREIPSLVADY